MLSLASLTRRVNLKLNLLAFVPAPVPVPISSRFGLGRPNRRQRGGDCGDEPAAGVCQRNHGPLGRGRKRDQGNHQGQSGTRCCVVTVLRIFVDARCRDVYRGRLFRAHLYRLTENERKRRPRVVEGTPTDPGPLKKLS